MKILALYPGLNPAFDEVAFALPPLIAHGCSVRVITSRVSALKSAELGNDFENFGGVEIFRTFQSPAELIAVEPGMTDEAMRLADEFKPDLLFINSPHCLPLARLMMQRHKVPAVLRLESADPLTLLRRRSYLGMPPLGRLVGRALWWNFSGEVDAIMVNDPADLPGLSALSVRNCQTYYAAHCAQRPEGLQLATERNKDEMIYIGSMIRHKNCPAWLETIPAILERTPVERFTVIGRGPFEHIVHELKKRYGERINHLPGVTRQEALERLAGAYFAYTEATSGWGFLCDAWSTGTPVLCPQSTFSIVPGWTGMMPQTIGALTATVQRLYTDSAYYQTMQEGGAIRYGSEHTATIVSKQYLQIFREVAATNSQG